MSAVSSPPINNPYISPANANPIVQQNGITSVSWSLMLDQTAQGGPGSGLGKVVQNLNDIEQCIFIILTTMVGEDPLRPTFGIDILKFIDMPITSAIPAIVGEVTRALGLWEPRISVQNVNVQRSSTHLASFVVTVTWALSAAYAVQPQTTTVPIGSPLNMAALT